MNKKVPKRRFQEFNNTDDWEQRKLGENAVIKGRLGWKSLKQEEYRQDGPSMIAGKHIKKGEIDWRKVDHIPIWRYEESPEIKLKNGDVIFSKDGSLGNPALITNLREMATINSTMMLVRTDNTIDSEFFYQIMTSDIFKKLVYIKVSGSSIPHLFQSDMKNFQFHSPTVEEQQKIGSFFKQLDNTIALHQRKLEKIKALKTAYLSEMFPAEGETKPKRRFAGFTDDWEQRKFEDCFKFPVSTNSLSRVMLNYDKGEVKNVHYGDVLIKYPCILNIKKEEIPYITGGCLKAYNSNLLENGDLIFADAAEDETVGKAVEVNGITNENLVSGLHTIVARATTQKAKYFLGYYINSDIYHRQLLRLMQGSKVSAISKGNLQKTDVSFPKDIEEQQKIGSYFKQLDDTITLHQRKLQKLQNIKKAYLNEMFI
ncbi:restriction endonuclease subunit S [Listeria monocytogenes]|nr:restriction endonuclease subunit S [Listeria monocytogenes]EAF4777617.1 restriction endonuclease subunit S [Listeria monocytogenes]EBB5846760.1 restriction endonuclease subunit S [Listeria monocytogenes]TYU33620.1 restriction endonuclease subunit S [Listeria monocytogenes]TYW04380.1 restriction endonuclease subunit S [Listeria monocytogenes]